MGGHQAGEIASQMFLEIAKDIIQSLVAKNLSYVNWRAVIESIFFQANQFIFDTAKRINKDGMGTTGVITIVDGNKLIGGWVGDSRIYRYSKKNLHQLSKDHSIVQLLIDNGHIGKEEGRYHPKKHILLRAIGTSADECYPDIVEYSLQSEDLVLLCSDGLSGKLYDEEIASIIEFGLDKESQILHKYKTDSDKTVDLKEEILKNDPLYYITGLLISKAKEYGGEDNISVCMLKSEQQGNNFWENLRKLWSNSNRKKTVKIPVLPDL